MNLRRLFIVALVITCAGVGPAAAADQDSGSRRDQRGDAPKALDITEVKVVRTAKKITAQVHVRDLTDAPGISFSIQDGDGELTAATFLEAGKVRTVLYVGEDQLESECTKVKARWRPAKDVVTIVTPVRCLIDAEYQEYVTWTARSMTASAWRWSDSEFDSVRRFKIR